MVVRGTNLAYIFLSRLTPYAEEIIGVISVDFDATVTYWLYILHSSNTWEKIGICEAVHHLFLDFKKTYDSGIIFSLSLVSHDIDKAYKTVYKWNL